MLMDREQGKAVGLWNLKELGLLEKEMVPEGQPYSSTPQGPHQHFVHSSRNALVCEAPW